MQHLRAPINAFSVMRVGVGPEEYAVEMSHVVAIEDADRLAESAWNDDAVGELRYLGQDIPVYWLAQRLGRVKLYNRRRRLERCYTIVVHTRRKPWALLVDRVSPVTSIDRERIHS